MGGKKKNLAAGWITVKQFLMIFAESPRAGISEKDRPVDLKGD